MLFFLSGRVAINGTAPTSCPARESRTEGLFGQGNWPPRILNSLVIIERQFLVARVLVQRVDFQPAPVGELETTIPPPLSLVDGVFEAVEGRPLLHPRLQGGPLLLFP